LNRPPGLPVGAERLLLASFALALAVLGGMGWYAWREAARYSGESRSVAESHAVMEAAHGLEAAIGSAESVQRAYLLTGEERWIIQLDDELGGLETELLNLRFLTAGDPAQQALLDHLESALGTWRDALLDSQLVRQHDGFEAAIEHVRAGDVTRLAVPVATTLLEIESAERDLLRRRRLSESAARRRALVAFVALPATAAALLGWLFLRTRSEIGLRRKAEQRVAALNAALERRASELEGANRELESFSYTASHDLRAPLRAIAGFGQILLDEHSDQLDSEGRRLFQAVRDNATKMARLLDGLLAFSRIGRATVQKSLVNHGEVVDRVLADLRASDENARRARIVVRPLPASRADPDLFARVWTNLIDNALKYSSTRDEPLVEVGGHERDGSCVYFVRDNGVGFDMKHSDKLFQVFERLHGAPFPGHGIGLAIAERIVSRHGGKIWAEGEPGVGATFWFSIPRGSE
jgi:signal transduction histidine kinase